MKILHLRLMKPTMDPRSAVVRDLFSATEGSADGAGSVKIELAEDGVGFWVLFSESPDRLWIPTSNVVSALFRDEPKPSAPTKAGSAK